MYTSHGIPLKASANCRGENLALAITQRPRTQCLWRSHNTATVIDVKRFRHNRDQTTSPFSGRHFDQKHPPWPSAGFCSNQDCQGTLEEARSERNWVRNLRVGNFTRHEEQHLRMQLWPTLSDPVRALMGSRCGPLAPAALTALPTICACFSHSHWPFAPADVAAFLTCGHHRAACSRAGVVGSHLVSSQCKVSAVPFRRTVFSSP